MKSLAKNTILKLIEEAEKALKNSYCPYSNYAVGSALLTKSGKIYNGVNIENASLGATNCAERTAIFKAVSEGDRTIKAIAIVSKSSLPYPCGICRQVISEFSEDAIVIIAKNKEDYIVFNIADLLPNTFKLN